jgi:hypothetical protein
MNKKQMATRTRVLSAREYDLMKKMDYIHKGKDGITRGIFFKKGVGTISRPVKRRSK